VPSRMVSVFASVNLPLHHKVQKFSSGTGHAGGPGKRAIKRLWCGGVIISWFLVSLNSLHVNLSAHTQLLKHLVVLLILVRLMKNALVSEYMVVPEHYAKRTSQNQIGDNDKCNQLNKVRSQHS